MKFYSSEFSVQSRRRMEIIDVTDSVNEVIKRSGIKNGFANIWVPHTTAAIAVNEHDPDLWEDILATMDRLVPQKSSYRHNAKYSWTHGEQNAHAHILNCLIKPCVTLPIKDGQILMGLWQSILFIELDGPRLRTVQVYVVGE
ncbi:MAG: secondary thiamine-phosphate synthase enzyme YjbQ [Candidatus Bathyarchaeota archaeon]|nr:secondary thiamine-phosphate synthase enzyme YjbQ [Candidatus Bathyarchaeota archaeon]